MDFSTENSQLNLETIFSEEHPRLSERGILSKKISV